MQVIPFTDDSDFAVQSSRSLILLPLQPSIETGRSVGNRAPCKSKSGIAGLELALIWGRRARRAQTLVPALASLFRVKPAAGLIVPIKVDALAVGKSDFERAALRHDLVLDQPDGKGLQREQALELVESALGRGLRGVECLLVAVVD